MQTWYECKVNYLKIDQGGFERKVTDNYLVDAVSFTDAESRIIAIMKELTRGDFKIKNIKPSNITDIINNKEGEWWFKVKIVYISIDEEQGKEKKVTNYCLVSANDIDDASKQLHIGLEYMLVPWESKSISLSTIADVFPYIPVQIVLPKSKDNEDQTTDDGIMDVEFEDEN